jgi:3-carboxy-cis,cis-muconate cycloisomerase
MAKIGLDVALLATTEVGEVAEADGGVSSTMPQKQNPVGSALAIACARQVQAFGAVLTAALPQEHERAVGAWHSEWPALTGALAFTGGAAAAARRTLEGLTVDAERMRENLDSSGGFAMAESASYLLAERHGRRAGHELVAQAAERAKASGRPLRDELARDLSPAELDTALDPEAYLGSSDAFIDRALAAYREDLR